LTGKSKTNFCSFLVQFLTKFNQFFLSRWEMNSKNFVWICLVFFELSCWQTNTHTHIHTYTHTHTQHTHIYTYKPRWLHNLLAEVTRWLHNLLAEVINNKTTWVRVKSTGGKTYLRLHHMIDSCFRKIVTACSIF
jgi:hypothetical protein